MTELVSQSAPKKLSAGAIIVRCCDDKQWRLLLLRAYRNWDFPKGMTTLGESPLVAAQREVEEETGLKDIDFKWGDIYIETAPYNRGKVARYYLAAVHNEAIELKVNPEIGRPEHHEYRWMTPFEARKTLSPRLQPILSWALDALGIAD